MDKMTEEKMEKKRNLWIIPTDKPSRLIFDKEENRLLPLQEEDFWMQHQDLMENQQIYITSDEEIKKRDIDKHTCIFVSDNGLINTLAGKGYGRVKTIGKYYKIILTTDQDLINDGVQAIDNEFLEWFVKNPSCESVDVESFCKHGDNCPSKGAYYKQHLCDVGYKIIIPKEEPKQETHLDIKDNKIELLEEDLECIRMYLDDLKIPENDKDGNKYSIIGRIKWQQETSYSEEDMKSFADWVRNGLLNIEYSVDKLDKHLEQWKKFKKK